MLTRRSLLAAMPVCALAGTRDPIQVGVTDWNLRMTTDPNAVSMARELGFDGLEVSFGRKVTDGRMPLDNAATQAEYLRLARLHKVTLNTTCLDILHVNYLKSDPLGAQWLQQAIPINAKLGIRNMLLPFFGKGAINTEQEQNYVADILKEAVPVAEKMGVVLALEDTISAEANLRILNRVGSKHLQVFYDPGNSAPLGFDCPKEIRMLGREHIVHIHWKDKGYLGEGLIDYAPILSAIREIGYRGWLDLETSAPSGSMADDMKRNLAWVRKFLKA
jgi:L-ribulose-5-phosphate 3-epimerase